MKRIALGLISESKNWREFIGNNLRRVQSLRALFRSSDFDVIVSFMDKVNVLVLLATLGLGVPVIVMERERPKEACGRPGHGRPSAHALSIRSGGCGTDSWH